MKENNVDNTEEFRCISLCTGYAGIELGLQRVIPNLRTVAYVEVEAYAVANLVTKIEENKLDAAPIWTDIKTFDGEPFRDRVHLITGGYPCQPFSVAGQRKGIEDPRHLWPYIERIIKAVRPIWCFFENVSGHLTIGFPEVYRSLRNMGYKVEAGLFTAAEVGAPHKRERLFILAHSDTNREEFRRRFNCNKKRQFQEEIQNSKQQFGANNPSQELVNTEHNGCIAAQDRKRDKERSGSNETGQDTTSEPERPSGEQLADSEYVDAQGERPDDNSQGWQVEDGQAGLCDRTSWPARPGQEQYEWEEPRVVYSSSGRSTSDSKQGSTKKSDTRKQNESNKAGNGQVKSGMGRTVDGFRSRVDELRLLGNGVVPQTAELAFRTLLELFT